ncbi:MAG TPA: Na+/H+ antiporter NhaA [Myxococcota bacterium]|nr:Na+/H+ antiporter NhaA [Myxococcota bacterium]
MDSPARAPVDRLLGPLQRFLQLEAASGLLLLGAAAVAFAWANSPWAASYDEFWHTPLGVRVGPFELEKPFLLWVNDGLMAVFFFVVGLEIKRELTAGELREPRRAALPLLCALGGMLVPALVYLGFNFGQDTVRGWAIPAATDIAFAVGVLALLGSRAPLGLKIFLTALAIADDLGAVVVIALFYTSDLDAVALVAAALAFATSFSLNRLGVRSPIPYAIVGVVLWFATLESGVHATVAGVIQAFAIPSRAEIPPESFAARVRPLLARLEHSPEESGDVVHELARGSVQVEAPLARIEHALVPYTSFVVMPVFALANAGVALSGGAGGALASPVMLGVALGLLIGKPLGVAGAAWLAVRAGVATLPAGVSWRQLQGAACLAGIGFTMSLFIAGLAFGSGPHGEVGAPSAESSAAKLGILAGSVVSGVLGWALLRRASPAR